MTWLNGKPSGSVVYASYGSTTDIRPKQIEELAWGLKASKCHFLWVVRESEEKKLPNKFKEDIGSSFEALSLGVAMVAVPYWADQPTNAKYVEDVCGTGIRALPDEKGIVRRQAVEECIKEVMGGEKGKKMKENAKKWKNLAREAIDEGEVLIKTLMNL
ncbi:hypothetical protein LWI28_016296 [Acer negundo]|uniref:Uncharacterized protein n=1 Tax=Acer negundo TaxID=4023 RepID=A0AAD5NSA2_ACENE|nr:hypothetical protein LWI28_016296 [Acer negundo]